MTEEPMQPAPQPAPQLAPPADQLSAEFVPTPDVAAVSGQSTSTKDMAMRLVGALVGQPPQMPPIPVPPELAPQPAPSAPPPPQPPVDAVTMADRFSDAPPPVGPDPIPDVPPEEQIALPQNTPENIGHAFAASRAEAKKFRQLAEQMRQQLEAERARAEEWSQKETDFTRQLEETRQRNVDLENEIGQMDLSRDPGFRAKYDAPLQQVQSQIVQTLVEAGYDESSARENAQALMLTESADRSLEDLGLDPESLGLVAYNLRAADGMWAERAQALDDWRQTREGVAEVSSRESAAQSAARRANVVEKAVEKARTIAPTMQWSGAEYDTRRDAAIEKAKAWYQTAPDEQIAAAAVEGFMAPFAYEVIERLQNEVNELRGQIAGRARLAAPPVAPFYSAPPPPRPAAPPPAQNVPWTPVDRTGDTNAMALKLVQGLLARN